MEFNRVDWGVYNGKKVELFTIKDPETSFEVHLLNFGAAINRVKIDDRDGNIDDIHYGRYDLDEITKNISFQGTIVGRVASLIGFGRFELNDRVYEVSKNMAKVHCQHGGFEGFNAKVWDCTKVEHNNDSVSVSFNYLSQDGEEGFPGNLDATITYTVKPLKVSWKISATTDKPTIVNMTNHAYWNLDGIHKSIDDLQLSIPATHFLKINTRKIILGTIGEMLKLGKRKKAAMEIVSIENFGTDITSVQKIGDIMQKFGDIDHNLFISIDNTPIMKNAGILISPKTGRKMTITTTEPNIVVYSGNTMKGLSSFGKKLSNYQAICLEPMKPTNCIQIPEIKDWVILAPNDTYSTETCIEFNIE